LTGIVIFFVLTGIVHAGDGPAVVSQELAKVTTSWNGAELPAYPAGTPEITILRIEIPAGTVLPRHKHPVINAGVLLQGELTVVTDEGDRLHLKAGESIVEVVDTWHYGMNEGADTAVIIVFYAGVAGVPVTVR
jgi:quercetin dioxygenase-like cupin family protein